MHVFIFQNSSTIALAKKTRSSFLRSWWFGAKPLEQDMDTFQIKIRNEPACSFERFGAWVIWKKKNIVS